MKLKQYVIIIFSVLTGIILALVFNLLIVENIFISDPCYYHSHDTNIFFDIFYDLPPSNGFHPFPSIINFILTGIFGAYVGLKFISFKKRKKTL